MSEQPTSPHDAITQELPSLDSSAAPAPGPGPRHSRRPSWTGRTRHDRAVAGATAAAVIVAAAVAVAVAGPRLYSSTSLSSPAPTTVPAVDVVAPAPEQAAPAPAPAAGQVDLVGKGFSRLGPDGDGEQQVAYAAVMRNRSSDQVAVGVTAHITFTGRGGAAMEVKDERLEALLPGQTGAVADDTDVPAALGMRVQVLVSRWVPAEELGLSGQLTAGDVRTATVAGKLTTTATLRSTLDRDLGKAEAVAVWYDRAGRILGGDGDGVDALAAGGAAPVLIDTSHAPAGIAKVGVYASPEDLFELAD
jgi:hypothetical protein